MKPFTSIVICALCACFIVGLQEFYFHYEKYVDLSIYVMACLIVLLVISAKQLIKEL